MLSLIWREGETTVRTIHEHLRKQQKTAYTTTLKMMQVMFDKGLVVKDTEPVAHIYTATLSRKQTQSQLLKHLANQAFDGSLPDLIELGQDLIK